MKRQVTVWAETGSKYIKVENRMLTGPYATDFDIKDVVKVPISDFLGAIVPENNFGLLPPGVRWMSPDGYSLLIEEAPSRKLVEFRAAKQGDFIRPRKEYRLPMPWLLYGISPGPNNLPYVSHIYAMPGPVDSLQDRLYWLTVPNTWDTGKICTHTLLRGDNLDGYSYHSLINLCIDEYWSSLFNMDIEHYARSHVWRRFYEQACSEPGLNSDGFAAWEAAPDDIWDHVGRGWSHVTGVEQLIAELNNLNPLNSMGAGDSSRLMTTLVAKSLEYAL